MPIHHPYLVATRARLEDWEREAIEQLTREPDMPPPPVILAPPEPVDYEIIEPRIVYRPPTPSRHHCREQPCDIDKRKRSRRRQQRQSRRQRRE